MMMSRADRRSRAGWGRWVFLLLAILAGVDLFWGHGTWFRAPSPPAPPPQAASSDLAAHARKAAEDDLATALRSAETARFRGMQVYQQADPRVLAVCGQVNPTGQAEQTYLPFVAVVTYTSRPQVDAPLFSIDHYVGASSAEATRTYVEMASRCGEGGGPQPVGTRQVLAPLPPVPVDLPNPVQPVPPPRNDADLPAQAAVLPPAAEQPAETPSATPAATLATVTMRQAGFIRQQPANGSQIVRTAPKGDVLTVFETDANGWLHVGETTREGWVYSGLVENQ
jgi:hypothetical protein